MAGRAGGSADQRNQLQVGGPQTLQGVLPFCLLQSWGTPRVPTTDATVICAYDITSKTGFYPLRKKKIVFLVFF